MNTKRNLTGLQAALETQEKIAHSQEFYLTFMAKAPFCLQVNSNGYGLLLFYNCFELVAKRQLYIACLLCY
jgi:hypothetical protein